MKRDDKAKIETLEGSRSAPGHSRSEQVYHLLLGKIGKGEYQIGELLPSGRKMASKLGFSTNPVHRALKKLEDQGYVVCIGRSGVRVQSFTPLKSSAKRFPIIDFITCAQGAQPQHPPVAVPKKQIRHSFKALEDWLWWNLNGTPGIRTTLSRAEMNNDDSFLARLREAEHLHPAALIFCLPEEFSEEAAETLRRLNAQGVPVVYYAGRREVSGIDRVYSDFITGQYLLTRYLLNKGYRRILRFAMERGDFFERLKQEGFLRALREMGYSEADAEKWTLPAQFEEPPCAYAAVLKDQMEDGERTAIMAHCDQHVFYIRMALKELKWEKTEVTGYDANWLETDWNEHFLFRDWENLHPELIGPEQQPASIDTQLPLVASTLTELVLARIHTKTPSSPQVRRVPQKLVLPNTLSR